MKVVNKFFKINLKTLRKAVDIVREASRMPISGDTDGRARRVCRSHVL